MTSTRHTARPTPPRNGGRSGARRGPAATIARELSAFGAVGTLGLLVDLTVFNLLFDSGQVVAKCISTAAAMTVTFLGNKYLSFSHRTDAPMSKEIVSFTLVNLVALGLAVAVLAIFEYPLHLKGDHAVMNAVNLGTIALGTILRYWAYRRFVFRQHPQQTSNIPCPHPEVPPTGHQAMITVDDSPTTWQTRTRSTLSVQGWPDAPTAVEPA